MDVCVYETNVGEQIRLPEIHFPLNSDVRGQPRVYFKILFSLQIANILCASLVWRGKAGGCFFESDFLFPLNPLL